MIVVAEDQIKRMTERINFNVRQLTQGIQRFRVD